MTSELAGFLIFWGIWLLIPILIDGLTYLIYLIGLWRAMRRFGKMRRETSSDFYPSLVTVIIPVYNGQHTLGPCLRSIRDQNYPQECLQVLVVDNGSTDESFEVFSEEQRKPFGGTMAYVRSAKKGKVWALNTGIHLAHGSLIINVDCDTMLRPDAVLNMARAFHAQPDLVSATGAILVMPVDRSKIPRWMALWARCEAVEYLEAFLIGRMYQTLTNSLFTLSGAFSAFRREALLNTFLYDRTTVSEDTKMTFDVRQQGDPNTTRIACVENAVAYVEPTLSISKLYAQRVRWQRGQLEVAALQPKLTLRNMLQVRGPSMSRTLMIDHTMAFPRLVWTFLMPFLYFLGYSMSLVVTALIGMYIFYALVEMTSMITCYAVGTEGSKRQVLEGWYLWAFMPIYRFMLFWFRFAGFLNALTEAAEWRVVDPWEQTKQGADGIRTEIKKIAGNPAIKKLAARLPRRVHPPLSG